MIKFFNKEYSFKELEERVGDFSQLAGVKRYSFTSGRSKGVEAVDVKTGSGLEYTILLDRALDIAWAEYKGIPLAYMTQAGVVAPQYYDSNNNEWLRSFTGGLMTTCGLSNVGAASEFDGVKYGQHGRISTLPGENIIIEEVNEGSDHVILIKGQVKQVKSFLENIVLHRTIKSYVGKNKIVINDIVENRSTSQQPFMLLYHLNFGFPLVNENSGLIIPNSNIKSGKQEKEFDVTGYDKFNKPGEDFEEVTTFFETVSDKNGDVHFLLMNDRDNPELALKVKYNRSSLDKLVMWKHLNYRNYVLCIEPANCFIKGIEDEYRNGTLEYLEPFGKKEMNIEIEVLEKKEEIFMWKEFLEKYS